MRLYIFQYGVTHDGNPIPGYLIITADQRHILVDTGFPASEGGAAAAPDFVKPEDHVLQHLAGIDLTPDDIEIVICTHFDPDHAGANELFTSAELIVQRRHDEFVRSTPVDLSKFTGRAGIILACAIGRSTGTPSSRQGWR